ncbi:MAG TPA: glycine--tRNA ligase subunit beta, partial [candidate division WOR-3 bacterium]|nr:glycine--tRNA ligase subunit beta [candidate division WOR-3 bacterium]
ALRRQAAGIFAIIFGHELAADLAELRRLAVGLFPDADPERAARLPGFFLERAAQALADRGIPGDVADAANAIHADRPRTALAAARALVTYRARPDFDRLAVGQKRVANILRGQDVTGRPSPDLFETDAERELWRQTAERSRRIEELVRRQGFAPALDALLELRPAIDRFFDDVLVMDKDEGIRTNRLRLLLSVRDLFRQVADLSRIVIENDA